MTRGTIAGDGADLDRLFGDRLLQVRPPWQACLGDSEAADCAAALSGLRNPYWIEDQPPATCWRPRWCWRPARS
jgi:hypothetical protein